MAKGGRYARKKEKKPLGAKKIVLIVIAVLLVLILAAVVAGVVYYNSMLNLISRPGTVSMETMSSEDEAAMLGTMPTTEETTVPTEETTVPTETMTPEENVVNIMLVGQAAREGETYRLSDTMMLCSINRSEKTLTLTSFQRDMRVVIPPYAGHTQGFNRMNVCYHLGSYWTGEVAGSMELLAKAVEHNFGAKVDHTVEVDFSAFQKVVNLLGGIDIEITEKEAEYMNADERIDIEPGLNHLNGYEALVYARMRKIDSDFKRTSRQRTVITKLLEKCMTMDLATVNSMLTEVLPLITTDMTNEDITGYVLEFLPVLRDLEITSQSIPFEGTYWSTNAGTEDVPDYVIDANLQKNKELLLESIGMVTKAEE